MKKKISIRVVLVLCCASWGLAACSSGGSNDADDSGTDADGTPADGASDAGDPGADEGADPGPGDDMIADAGGDEIDWEELNGSVPDQALEAPEFDARNRDGAPRSQQDLLGHPTLMWFYPKASTSG